MGESAYMNLLQFISGALFLIFFSADLAMFYKIQWVFAQFLFYAIRKLYQEHN